MSQRGETPPSPGDRPKPPVDLKGRRHPAERIPWQAGQGQQPTRQHDMPPSEPEASGWYIPWWGFALVIVMVAAITCGLWGFVLLNRGDTSTAVGASPTPIFVVITATPTLGPAPDEITPTSESVQVTDVPIPVTPTPKPLAPIAIGKTVEVFGTEGDGLSIRQGPGRNYPVFFIGQDGERFIVRDGPEEAEGFVWWLIEAVADPNRSGWSVEDFLTVIN